MSAAIQARLAEAQRTWKIDDKQASQIVLDANPGILTNAQIFSSMTTFSARPLPEFADNGRHAWIVMIFCNDGRMHARFFVHPVSGKAVASVHPGDRNSVRCT